MPWDLVVFYLLAAVCILAAGGVVAASNPVHSAIFLVICFFNVAGVFVMMGAEFLAVIQVIVYTGAIMVLILFVLMLVDPDDLPEFHQGRPVQRAVGVLLGVILFLEVSVAILNRQVVGMKGNATAQAIDAVGGNTQALGRVLYSDYLFAFEVCFPGAHSRCDRSDRAGVAGAIGSEDAAATRDDFARAWQGH